MFAVEAVSKVCICIGWSKPYVLILAVEAMCIYIGCRSRIYLYWLSKPCVFILAVEATSTLMAFLRMRSVKLKPFLVQSG